MQSRALAIVAHPYGHRWPRPLVEGGSANASSPIEGGTDGDGIDVGDVDARDQAGDVDLLWRASLLAGLLVLAVPADRVVAAS